MKFKFLILLSFFFFPYQNFASESATTQSHAVEIQMVKKKKHYKRKKKGGIFKGIFKKNKCKCPKN